mgnify:FL=1
MNTRESEIPGSFRDPKGRVFRRDGRIYRGITEHGLADFEKVRSSGLLDDLAANGLLVPWWDADDAELDAGEPVRKIIEHAPLAFVSYPYEWSFGGLRAAALLHLEIQLRALDRDVTLSDASAYNVQFDGPRPIFIDHLSFRPYRDGEYWLGHRQFCEQFLNPLLLRACLGVPHNDWYRGSLEGIPSSALATMLPLRARLTPKVLTHVTLLARLERRVVRKGDAETSKIIARGRLPRRSHVGMLRALQSWISGLRPRDAGAGPWSEYADCSNYSADESGKKEAFVADFATRTKPKILWDIGCNTGDYTKAALAAGTERAIGFEYDAKTLEIAFERSVAETLQFLPLRMDLANPSPAQGWSQTERDGLWQRRNADGVLALAILHHLCISRNLPLAQVVPWIVGLAPCGVIEFVPKADPMAQQLLRNREDVFADYSDADFDRALAAVAKIAKSEKITDSGRRLVWYERNE